MSRLIAQVDRFTGSGRESVPIIDDSLFSRSNSKKAELLERVFDHTGNKFCRGFHMLALGWSDGNTFLPVSFSFLSSAKDSERNSGKWLAIMSTDTVISYVRDL